MAIKSDKMRPISNFEKPNPLPKYFGIDIDGTFYTTNEEVYKSNVESFKMMKDKGIAPFFCTGRNLLTTKMILGEEFFSQTGFTGYPGVYLNGSLVYDPSGNIIKMERFSLDFLDKFIKFMFENGIQSSTVFCSEREFFCIHSLSEHNMVYLYKNKMKVPELVSIDELKTKNVLLISIPTIKFDIVGLKNGVDYHHKKTDEFYAVITPGGCTKKSGIELLLKSLNTDGSNCTYIGDGENDIEAMEYCASSFAVGNSPDDVKSHSSWVVDLNNDQGAFRKVANCMYL